MSSQSLSLAPRACEFCGRRDELLRCSGCHAVYYCGRDHQTSDRDAHKKGCVATKKARAHLEREEQKLRNMPGDMFTPSNVFENGFGCFWGIYGTRPYMRARLGLVDMLLEHFGSAGGRLGAVEASMDHLLDMLWLCRSDNMGLRDLIPALYIRLNRDQAAYDFLKWYATTGQDSHYNWGDTSLPFLDVKDADVLESPEGMWSDKKWLELSHAVAVALIKVRILLDLQAVQEAPRTLRGTLPQETMDRIRGRPVDCLVESCPEIFEAGSEAIARLVETIRSQVGQLYTSIDQYNSYFWRLMLNDPDAAIAARPASYSHRTKEEACLMIGYNFAAWAETPGAINVIRSLRQAH